MLICAAGSPKVISTGDTRVLEVLNAFSTPKTFPTVCAELERFDRGFLLQTVLALWQIDFLAESYATDASFEGDAGGVQSVGDEQAELLSERAGEFSRTVAHLARKVGCDLGGFGRSLFRTQGVDADGAGIIENLLGAAAILKDVARGLEARRGPYLREQLERLPVGLGAGGYKLNVGSGSRPLEGWVNMGLPPADICLHLGWPLPFEDETVSHVYLAHVLEHLYYPKEAAALLLEIHRVMKPGARLRVVVPDIEKLMRAYASGDEGFFERRRELWPSEADCQTPLEQLLKYAGAGVKPRNLWGHKFGYDFETLRLLLERAGFREAVKADYMESVSDALRVDDFSHAAGHKHGEVYYSLFVEAVK